MKNTQPVIMRNWSGGTIRTVQNTANSPNFCKLGLNLMSNKEHGSMVTRLGTDIVGVQAVDGATCYGLHYHRDNIATNHKLFGVFSDGVSNDIYDMLTGTKSLEDDTDGAKTRFCTYLNSTVRVNGTDAAKSYNGSAWVTSGGAFDENNMPLGSVVAEWRDRIYTAGVASSPSIIYYSSVADPDARTISWTVDLEAADTAGQIEIEQEDNGGKITALEKVPGYLLIFKERSMKRWDGSSTNPEDLVDIGAPTQEAVCRGREMVFIANEDGVWVTNGGYPQLISEPIQDLWDAIPAANIDNIATHCDMRDLYVYVGDITLGLNTYSNICFIYHLDQRTWDIYSYGNDFTCFTWYIDSNSKVIVGGDKDGQALKLNSGYTDYPSSPINWTLETQDIDFQSLGRYKEVNQFNVYTRNVSKGQLFYRANSNLDRDWKSIGNITNDVENRDNFKAKGNWFNHKLSGTTNSEQSKILGFEVPEGAINIAENDAE